MTSTTDANAGSSTPEKSLEERLEEHGEWLKQLRKFATRHQRRVWELDAELEKLDERED